MSGSEKHQLRLLYLQDYLLENSDDEHTVSAKELIEYLLSKEIYIERKSLYRNIQLLNDIYRKNAIDYVTYDNHKKAITFNYGILSYGNYN